MDEEELSKKLDVFLTEMVRFGCVQGFKHIVMKMRGKEELFVTIANHSSACTPAQSPNNSIHQMKNLPRNESSLLLSARTQRSLSGFGYMDVGLPPASPSENDDVFEENLHATVFLIAGYSMYNCPYAWVRSNHERLVKIVQDEGKDSPLNLHSTSHFATEDVKIFDIVAELVTVNTRPPPLNPFAVDFSYFECLSKYESVIASGAMVDLLVRILQHRTPSYHKSSQYELLHGTFIHTIAIANPPPFSPNILISVLRDVNRLVKQHFSDVASLAHMRQSSLSTISSLSPFSTNPSDSALTVIEQEEDEDDV
eukprot:m.55507 g.55507  ORF g.55507 m.55507 type:complete len:311 (-) comp7756_c1_seq1:3784-4716(-)